MQCSFLGRKETFIHSKLVLFLQIRYVGSLLKHPSTYFWIQAECTTILRYTLYSLLLTEWPQPTGHCHANEDLPPLGDVVDGGSFHLDIEKRPFSNTTLATAWYGHTTSTLAPGWMSPIFLPHSFIFYSSEKPQAVQVLVATQDAMRPGCMSSAIFGCTNCIVNDNSQHGWTPLGLGLFKWVEYQAQWFFSQNHNTLF